MLGEYGFPTPAALGIVEITPEREYLIAMDFFDDAAEIGEAEIDEHVIDQGLAMIRLMWDVGLAHRDVKPASSMVLVESSKLIDLFFVQVRPSPWRQAVDLGNMMLVLALRSDAQTVYDAALRYFTPNDLSEAFAATRGVASPTQLRQHLKDDGRDLLAEFRSMAPARQPISVQRWSIRRVALILASLVLLLLAGLTGLSCSPHPRHRDGADVRHWAIDAADGASGADRHPASVRLNAALRMGGQHLRDRPGKGELRGRGGRLKRARDGDLHGILPGSGRGHRADPHRRRLRRASRRITDPDAPSFAPGGGFSFMSRADLVAAVDADVDQVLCGALAPSCP